MENEEFIREFLEESEENLDQLDQDFVSLEQDPHDLERLDSIYRAIHTIKGTSGFFGFSKLGAVAHAAENLLSRLRDGDITLNEGLTSALLASVDAIRDILANIAREDDEGDGDYRSLNQKLEDLASHVPDSQSVRDFSTNSEIETLANDDATTESLASELTEDQNRKDDTENEETNTQIEANLEPSLDPTQQQGRKNDAASEPTENAVQGDDEPSQLTSIRAPKANNSADNLETDGGTTYSPSENSQTAKSHESAKAHAMGSDGSIRVDVALLNQMMDLVGELVLARNQLLQTEHTEDDPQLTNVTQQVDRITSELQERVMQTRMQPIGNIWGKFPRLVRDLAVMCGKEVDLTMDGFETEVDKSLLEAIRDPLTHLIRNAIDHGIESTAKRIACGKDKTGNLHLRAWHQGGKVNIEISDDGQGIDPAVIRAKAISKNLVTADTAQSMDNQQLVQIIFWPGFSTAPHVTGISGRGVGMDVVKTNIESIGGTIEIKSQVGVGTSIKVKVPLTLAIVPALVISNSQQLFAIPQSHLVEMLRVDLKDPNNRIEHLRETPVYRLRGELLPIAYLNHLLGQESTAPVGRADHLNIVVLQADNCRFGLVVDHVERMEEIVVKSLHPSLGVIPHLAGATVMGNGRLALILDIVGLATDLGLAVQELNQCTKLMHQPLDEQRPNQMLIFRLSNEREVAMPLSEIERLEDIPLAKIEKTDQMLAVQYRGQIMPLMPLSQLFDIEDTTEGYKPNHQLTKKGDTAVKAIVINVNGSHTAIAVHEIVDVAEQEGPLRMTSTPGSLIRGATVVHGRVTDVLDVQAVLQHSGFRQHSHTTATS